MRLRRLNASVSVAYPGNLGLTIPAPPNGYVPMGIGDEAMNQEEHYIIWNGLAWIDPNTGLPVA